MGSKHIGTCEANNYLRIRHWNDVWAKASDAIAWVLRWPHPGTAAISLTALGSNLGARKGGPHAGELSQLLLLLLPEAVHDACTGRSTIYDGDAHLCLGFWVAPMISQLSAPYFRRRG